jgi:hypothetical protein
MLGRRDGATRAGIASLAIAILFTKSNPSAFHEASEAVEELRKTPPSPEE